MQSLTKKVYNEVHAQRPSAFINVDLHFLYELRVLFWQKKGHRLSDNLDIIIM